MTATRVYTIDDLEALPDDGHVYELIDGELVRREPVGGRHGAMGAGIVARLWLYAREHDLGEVFVSETIYAFGHDPELGLKPDASFVRSHRLPSDDVFDKPLEVIPDLVVEVVSPNDRAGKIDDKLAKYRRFGVPLLWVLWPRRRAVTVYAAGKPTVELTDVDVLDGGDVLPGFRVAVADLFRVGR